MLKIIKYLILFFLIASIATFYKCEKENNLPRDGDGNEYDTVVIGTQTWLAENLKTTKYNNGVDIPLVTDNNIWASMSSAAFCWYGNNPASNNIYGALYNGGAVNISFLCPVGYHVPNDEEWNLMFNYLGGNEVAGNKLKVIGTQFWGSGNYQSTNASGFTAMPGGMRDAYDGTFKSKNSYGYWWSSTSGHYIFIVSSNNFAYIQGLSPRSGFSVRCIKD